MTCIRMTTEDSAMDSRSIDLTEPRTCETCGTRCLPNERVYVNPDAEDPCPGWTPRSPQSADVETVRKKIELAIKFGLPIDARMALKEALEALDRIAGKLH